MTSYPRPVMRIFRALPQGIKQRAVRAASPSYTLGAQARIERDDGRILLVKASYRWRWGLPGGLLDQGESPAQAAIREAREETSLDIELVGDPTVIVETTAQRVNFIFDAVPAAGADPDKIEPQASEILELGWFDVDKLPDTVDGEYEKILLRQASANADSQLLVTTEILSDRPEGEARR